jgi:hypothetical protein
MRGQERISRGKPGAQVFAKVGHRTKVRNALSIQPLRQLPGGEWLSAGLRNGTRELVRVQADQ